MHLNVGSELQQLTYSLSPNSLNPRPTLLRWSICSDVYCVWTIYSPAGRQQWSWNGIGATITAVMTITTYYK